MAHILKSQMVSNGNFGLSSQDREQVHTFT